MNTARFLELLRQGCADPDHAARYHKGGKGAPPPPPPAPDYSGAAREQAQASKDIATQTTWADRPDLTTPWGQQTWSSSAGVDPATGQPITKWSSNISLAPEQQAALQSQMDIQQGRSQAAETLLGQATGAFQSGFDWGGLPAAARQSAQPGTLRPGDALRPGDVTGSQRAAYETMSAMQEPGRERQREALRTRLANQGLAMGTEAYKGAERDLAENFEQQDKSLRAQALAEGRADVGAQFGMQQQAGAQNFAQQQAAGAQNFAQQQQAIAQQQQLRQQAIAEQAQKRGMSLNELNALLTGQQVGMPQMPTFNQATQAQAPNLLGAAQSQGSYGQAQQQLNQQMSPDWGSLLGTGMMAAGAAGMF